MSAPGDLDAAAERVVVATRAARTARIAAAPELRRRAARRSRLLRWALVAGAVLAVALVVVSLVLGLRIRSANTEEAVRAEVLDAADAAVLAMVSADPADPQGYVERILALSTGALHERLSAVGTQLADEVGSQRGPSVGQLVSSGLVADPPADPPDGARAQVLTVVDATNPALLGGAVRRGDRDLTAQRITVVLTMTRTADGWRVEQARAL